MGSFPIYSESSKANFKMILTLIKNPVRIKRDNRIELYVHLH